VTKHKRNTILSIVALGFLIATWLEANDAFSRSFFASPDEFFQRGHPIRETLFDAERADKKYDGIGGALEIAGYYSQSVQSDHLAKYFSPFGKVCLNVVEFKLGVTDSTGAPTPNQDSDYDMLAKNLEARHFNIATISGTTTFQSTIKLKPRQTVAGIGIAYRQTLWRGCEDEMPRLWLDIALPIEYVRNQVKLLENITSTGGGSDGLIGLDGTVHVSNMTQAFQQAGWLYGKIDSKCRCKWGLSDVEVALGWGTYWGDCSYLNGYLGFLAPTGTKINKKNAAYVFSPVVGNNHHWGLIFGSYYGFDVWHHNEHEIDMAASAHGRVLFKNKQWRSFDLKDKDWSRYAEVYTFAQAAAASFPANENSGSSGINYFTQCLEINPRWVADFNTAILYTHCHWNAEIGYNFFIRHAEQAKLCQWTPQIAQKDVLGSGFVNIARTINKHFRFEALTYTAFNEAQIQKSDLNLDSATHPAVLTNLVYGSLGYNWTSWCDTPAFASIGGSYEFSTINTTIDRWTVWGKLGVSF
jgi:hypothetical protein